MVILRRFRYLLDEKGQALVLFALLFPVLCGFMGFAVDIGWITYSKIKLKSASDLAVLAGAQDIPETYRKEDLLKGMNPDGTPFDCKLHNTLNLPPTNDKETTLKYLCENYPSSAIEQITLGKSAKIPGQEFYGIKANISDKIPLYFMPLLGINETTIHAESYVVVEKPAKPPEVIPVAFDLTELNTVMAGLTQTNIGHCLPPDISKKEVVVWTEDTDTWKGNFGLLNITGNMLGDNIDDMIDLGIPHPVWGGTPPLVGSSVMTKTGSTAKHVGDGFHRRITAGRVDVWMPVVDMSKAKGETKLPVLGYTMIRGIRTKIEQVPDSQKYKVCVYGTFEKRIEDNAGLFGMKVPYYGVKRIALVDLQDYESKYK